VTGRCAKVNNRSLRDWLPPVQSRRLIAFCLASELVCPHLRTIFACQAPSNLKKLQRRDVIPSGFAHVTHVVGAQYENCVRILSDASVLLPTATGEIVFSKSCCYCKDERSQQRLNQYVASAAVVSAEFHHRLNLVKIADIATSRFHPCFLDERASTCQHSGRFEHHQ